VKLIEIVRFELAWQLRQRTTWISLAAMYALAFLLMRNFMETAREGGTPVNAPVSILNAVLVTSLFSIVVMAALFGEAASRDPQTRFAPLIFSSSVREHEYLSGRFLGAFIAGSAVVSVIPLGALTAILSSDAGGAVAAPFRWSSYLTPQLLIVLPNVLIAGGLLFTSALLSKRMVAGFILSVVLGFGSLLTWEIAGKVLGLWSLAAWIDPLGFAATANVLRSWSNAERSTLGLPVGGVLLGNRLLWLLATFLYLAVVQYRFRFSRQVSEARTARRSRNRDEVESPSQAPIVVPRVERSFGPGARLRKTLTVALLSFRQILSGRLWLVPVAALVLFAISGPELLEHLGTPLVPETTLLLVQARSLHYDSLIVLLTILYAGELVWRDREVGMNLLVDPLPVTDGALLWGKLIGLGMAIGLFQLLLMLTSIGIQLSVGHTALEPLAYLRVLFAHQFTDFLLFAAVAIASQVILNQKYLGYLAGIVAYAFTLAAPRLGIEHKLLIFAADPGWSHSALTGFTPFGPVLLFKAYWYGWALLAMMAARMIWIRSTQPDLHARLQHLRRGFGAASLLRFAAVIVAIAVVGGAIFYNTNVLNDYFSESERGERRARYETKYGRYEHVPQPRLDAVRLQIELYPEEEKAAIAGRYRLVNDTNAAIDTLHLATAAGVETRNVRWDRKARVTLRDRDLGYEIHSFEAPLLPGEQLVLDFEVAYEPRGFTNSGTKRVVLPEATYFEPAEWLPAIGYQDQRRLRAPGDRKRHGLPPRPEVAPLGDRNALMKRAGRETIDLEVIVGTAGDQLAIAPGALRRAWRDGGRRYFHYATDVPIHNLYAVFSAGYAVHKARWRDVDIEVAHDPRTRRNVERTVRSVAASLEYLTREFGPYPHGQIRVVAAPGPLMGLRSYPVNIRYYETSSLMVPERDPRNVDFLFGVIAHEMAHQWWGNQLIPAQVEGAPLLSESLAWYSAFGVVESEFGKEHLERFLDVMREAYLVPRPAADVPLLRASDWLDAFRRGPFAMYSLRTMIGEERVNLALRRLLQKYAGADGPRPTSVDLYRELRLVSPPGLHSLLADLFERNVYWNLSTRRAFVEPLSDGSWQLTLDATAGKVAVDEHGNETVMPMSEPVEIGVYDADGTTLRHLVRYPLTSGNQEIRLTVPFEPRAAAIDPRRLLIDPAWRNNTIAVKRAAE